MLRFRALVRALALALVSFASLAPRPADAAPAPGFLSARDGRIFDSAGDPVLLRGVSFGGWLLPENWIAPLAPEWQDHLRFLAREAHLLDDLEAAFAAAGPHDESSASIHAYLAELQTSMIESAGRPAAEAFWLDVRDELPVVDPRTFDRLLRDRFGDDGALEVHSAFHDAWIGPDDFRRAAALGFDYVRIPLWYVWFQSDEPPHAPLEYGYRRLDDAVRFARDAGLRLLLDLHGAPGGQNAGPHSGDVGRAELFGDRDLEERVFAFWRETARRYADEPVVWAFEALNEPSAAPSREDWIRVHDGIHRAVRAHAPRTVLVMGDGYKLDDEPHRSEGFFPRPADLGWTNVAYSLHLYQVGSLESHRARLADFLRVALAERDRTSAPVLVGEFSTLSADAPGLAALRLYADEFRRNDLSWALWNWKIVGERPPRTLWGVYQYDGDWTPPVLHRVPKEDLLRAIARMKSENFAPLPAFAEALGAILAGAPPEPAP